MMTMKTTDNDDDDDDDDDESRFDNSLKLFETEPSTMSYTHKADCNSLE